jgi:DNA-binding MarR family transcriptional regulator
MAHEQLKLENQLCFPLYAAAREVTRSYKPLLDPLDITYPQYLSMLVLWEYGEQSVSELGNKLRLDSGTLTPLLKKLESKGLVSRRRDKSDERRVMVSLTDDGRALEDLAVDIPKQLGACVPLAKEDAEVLYGVLRRLLAGYDEQGRA